MRLLLDTHLLIWAAGASKKISKAARRLIENPEHELLFSAASIWEIAIKAGLQRPDFQVDPRVFRRALLDNGYVELPITGEHAVNVDRLPVTHKDPFDRMLVAQATAEGIVLLTTDETLARYPGPIRLV